MVQKKVSTQKINQTNSAVDESATTVSESDFTDKQKINKVDKLLSVSPKKTVEKVVVEDLFNNYNINPGRIFRVNFVRGIFFGAGSVIGGTVGVALLVWFLSFFIEWPVFGDVIEQLVETLTRVDQ